ncbi:MAG: pantetheine-phosphate adenylyltransferase [Solirubrobacterales bacterium]
MKTAVYPGSFDPVTNGHVDVFKRAAKMFDRLIVSVVYNVYKQAFFSVDERIALLQEVTRDIPNIEIESFSGLLTDYVRDRDVTTIVRGLRTISDFEYEMHMAMMNNHLAEEVDTVFIMCNPRYFFVSSSGVKEAALLGGSVSGLVPEVVENELKKRMEAIQQSGETYRSNKSL